MPFDIPDNWMWIRLKNIANITAGGTPDRGTPKYWNGEIPWLKISDITSSDKFVRKASEYITEDGMNNSSAKIMRKGTILYTIFATIGEVGILDIDATCNQAIAGLDTYDKTVNDFLYFLLINLQDYMKSISKGCAQFNINQKILKNTIIALPPLEEQLRIVDKISSFEPLLLQYELAETKLSQLEQEFPDKLKKSILQCAIEGKLVKQDPNDEPASILLERIKAEKEKLIKEGKIKRDKNESYIYQGDDKNYYENFLSIDKKYALPDGWVYTCLSNISEFIQRGKSPEYSSEQKIPIIAQKCNQKDGKLSLDKALFLNPSSIQKYSYNKISSPGDIIINSTGTGTVGRVNILSDKLFQKYEVIVTDSHVTTVRLVKGLINNLYVYYFLKSPVIYNHVEARSEGSTNQIELYAKTIMGYAIPFPPRHEQDKIVEKITTLLNYIDN